MLRAMCFENFVHFKLYQFSKFEPGANFIVGPNSSGKSTILELIRRSMNKRINTSITSSYDESKRAFLVCQYDITDYPRVCRLSGLTLPTSSEEIKLLSIVIKNKTESRKGSKENNRDVTWTKIVCVCYKEKVILHAVRYNVDVKTDSILYNECAVANANIVLGDIPNLLDLYNKGRNEKEEITKELKSVENKLKYATCTSESDIMCEQILGFLENKYVSTAPMRSINPIQWNKSKLRSNETDTCKEAANRAEILAELLGNDKVDQEKAAQIFEELTYPLIYEFQKSNGNITLLHKNDEPPEKKEVPLLKTPEGLIEAQQTALIIAHKEYRTFCLEEPDRGMHPRMVERLCNVFLDRFKEDERKVLIFVSHNPSFLNSWTADKTQVCVRKKLSDSSKSVHSVYPLNINEHFRKITDTDEIKKILFASRILFVEGKSDKIIVQGLFDHISKYGYVINKKDLTQAERRFLTGYQVICLNSNTFERTTREYCECIGVSCAVLLDRDAIIKVENKTNNIQNIRLEGISEEKITKFDGRPVTCLIEDEEEFTKLTDVLSGKNIFIWKHGHIEDTVLNSLKTKTEKIKQYLGADRDKKKTKKKFKESVLEFNRDELSELIKEIKDDPDICRLISFLRGLMDKEFQR